MLRPLLRCEGKLQGDALSQVHDEDRRVEIDALEETLADMRHEYMWARRDGDKVLIDSLAESIDALIVIISGLEDGSFKPQVQAYDPADRFTEQHGSIIDWQRWTEKEIAESKRIRRMRR